EDSCFSNNVTNFLSLYVDLADSETRPAGWTVKADISLTLVDQVKGTSSLRKYSTHNFNAEEHDWGFTSFVAIKELRSPNEGFFVNDTLIVQAEVCTAKRTKFELNLSSLSGEKGHGGEAGSQEETAELSRVEVTRLGEEDLKLEAEIRQLSARKAIIFYQRSSTVAELDKANQEAVKELEELKKQCDESRQAVENRMRAKERLAQSNAS
ncbi:unnamed protein product, partial [Linum tenue]